MNNFNDAQFFSEKDNFSMGWEQLERPDQGDLVVDVVRKEGKHPEMTDGISDSSELDNDIKHCQIVVDDLKVLKMTREDLDALDECWERISVFSTKLDECSHVEDTLFLNDVTATAELDTMKNLSYEEVVKPVKETRVGI